jgi:hypothetical protein
MVSHIRKDADKLIAALDEARRYLPPKPPVGMVPQEPALALDVPTGLPAALAATTFPFVGQGRMEQASAHQKMALAICESGARKALASITARIHALPACAQWKPSLGVAMDEKGKMSLWVGGEHQDQAVARAVLPAKFASHLDALAFALRFCAPIDRTRLWSFNSERFLYPAQDAVDAALLGVALFNPSAVRTVCRGGIVHADVAERFSNQTLLGQLQARMDAVLPKQAKAALAP